MKSLIVSLALFLFALVSPAFAEVKVVGKGQADHYLQRGGVMVGLLAAPAAGEIATTVGVDPSGSTLTTQWTSGSLVHIVSTPKKVGETPNQQAQRHNAAVAATVAIFPPNPPN